MEDWRKERNLIAKDHITYMASNFGGGIGYETETYRRANEQDKRIKASFDKVDVSLNKLEKSVDSYCKTIKFAYALIGGTFLTACLALSGTIIYSTLNVGKHLKNYESKIQKSEPIKNYNFYIPSK